MQYQQILKLGKVEILTRELKTAVSQIWRWDVFSPTLCSLYSYLDSSIFAGLILLHSVLTWHSDRIAIHLAHSFTSSTLLVAWREKSEFTMLVICPPCAPEPNSLQIHSVNNEVLTKVLDIVSPWDMRPKNPTNGVIYWLRAPNWWPPIDSTALIHITFGRSVFYWTIELSDLCRKMYFP